MEVHAAAGLVGKGLGHHREHHALRLSQRMRGLLEQHQVIGAGQRIAETEVQLELTVGVPVVDLQHVQAAGFQRLLQRLQVGTLARQALQVVAGFVQPIKIVGRHPTACDLLEQEELGLDPGVQVPAFGFEPGHLAPQHLAGTGVERLAGDKAIAHHAGVTRQPGQGGDGAGGAAGPVLAARAATRQAGAGNRRTREADALGQQVIQVRQRHVFASRHAVDVGELGNQRVHALVGQTFLEVFHRVSLLGRVGPVSRRF